MTLRASMLVPLIYGPPNLRRVTYIVSQRCGFLFTRRYLRGRADLDLGELRNRVSCVLVGASTSCKPSRAGKPEPVPTCNRCSVETLSADLKGASREDRIEECPSAKRDTISRSRAIARLSAIIFRVVAGRRIAADVSIYARDIYYGQRGRRVPAMGAI